MILILTASVLGSIGYREPRYGYKQCYINLNLHGYNLQGVRVEVSNVKPLQIWQDVSTLLPNPDLSLLLASYISELLTAGILTADSPASWSGCTMYSTATVGITPWATVATRPLYLEPLSSWLVNPSQRVVSPHCRRFTRLPTLSDHLLYVSLQLHIFHC